VSGSRVRWVFAVAALVCGMVYWRFRDWWAYVQFPEGPMPKFVVPWWWQVIESGVIGFLAGGFLASGLWLVWLAWFGRSRRCSRRRPRSTAS
jgi:hypothetical protein